MIDGVGVVHLDDDREFGALTAEFVEREDDRISVTVETHPEDALGTIRETGADCVVSDYEMPGMNGIEFLETIREEHPDFPFILFTGKGSEEVASRAVSAGVTDYLQKRPGTEQFTLLANRITHAVERFRSQREARRRKQRLETFVGNLPGVVYRCSDDPGWPMEYVAGNCESLTGYAASALEGDDVLWEDDVVHPADRSLVREAVRSALEDGEPFECTYRIRTADDHTKWVRERGHEVFSGEDGRTVLEGSILDATESEEQEREFRRSRRRFEAVFDDPNMLVGLLDADGTVLDANPTAMAYVDAGREAVVGSPFWETPWWAEDLRADVRRWVDAAVAGEYVEYEAEHPQPDGEPITVEGTLRPVTAADGDVTAIVVSARDVTERRSRERELKRRNERLDRFANFISHDLQNPISAAKGRLELAVETGEMEHVERASRAIDRIDERRQNLVDALRTGEVVSGTERVDVGDVIEEIASSTVARGTVSLDAVEPVRVDGDPDAVRRMLENVVRNSIEHGGADVTIRVGPVADGFYYEDDGPGIDPAHREDVFKLGFTTKSGGEGVGLGMASVEQIVRSHGWSIEVTDPDHLDGVRFEVHTD